MQPCKECPFIKKNKKLITPDAFRVKKPRACHMKQKGFHPSSKENECIGHRQYFLITSNKETQC